MLKKFIDYVMDSERELSDRTFLLMSVTSFTVLCIIFIWDICIGEPFLKLLGLGIGLVGLLVMLIIAMKTGRVQFVAVIVTVVLVFVLLPIEFFTGGGINGCTPIWYAYSFMYVGINLKGKKRYIMMLTIPASAIACYLIAYQHPMYLIYHNTKTAYLDSIASLIAVGCMLFFIVAFLIRVFQKENAQTKRQKEEIEELNRSQNRFFSSMSHEIRTPINTIIGLNEMTLREETSTEVAENSLTIQAASKMLLTTINDILDMSKIESGKMDIVPVEYDVGELFSEIVNLIWARCREKGLEFHIDVDVNIPRRLYGDEIRIKQILINLLNNAIKYTEKGSVTLQVQCTAGEKPDRVQVLFSVSDTGMGIKKENIPYLFDAFRRVDVEQNRQVEGTGLGLAIVKQLVDLMGGEITVNSIYTKGSTFIMTLEQGVIDHNSLGELGLSTRHTLNSREHYRQSFEAPKAKVLIVDDNEANLMVEAKLLRDTKIHIDLAESGKECLERTRNTAYNCIFMDHLMPGMDGIECLKAIRSQKGGLNRDVPVIVLTANAGADNKELYREAGFDDYLLKPVTGPLLETALVHHLPKELVHLTDAEVMSSQTEAGLFRKHSDRIPILVTSESVCDLPKLTTEKLNIPLISYRIFTEEGDFLDGAEVEADGLLDYIAEGHRRIRAKEPSVADYVDFFARALTKANQVIHLALSDDIGYGYENACEAATTFDNVTVFNTRLLSGAMGLLVIQGHRLAATEKTVDAVIDKLTVARDKMRFAVMVNTPDFLYHGNHISGRVASFARAFMLHPVVTLKKGKFRVKRLYAGNLEHCWERFIKNELINFQDMDDKIAMVNYVGLSFEQQQMLEKMIRTHSNFKTLVFQKSSPAISANCGPLAFGLMVSMKK